MVRTAGRRLIDGGTCCEDVRERIRFGEIPRNVGGEIKTEGGGGSASSNAAVAVTSMAAVVVTSMAVRGWEWAWRETR